jgi:hypothetical protein
MSQFSVYNFGQDDESEKGRCRDPEYETIFGPFAEWIVRDGMSQKTTGYRAPGVSTDPFDNSQHNALYDIMRLVAAYEQLSDKIINGNGQHTFVRSTDDEGVDIKIQGKVRMGHVVLYGVFQVEEITTPAPGRGLC